MVALGHADRARVGLGLGRHLAHDEHAHRHGPALLVLHAGDALELPLAQHDGLGLICRGRKTCEVAL